MQGLEVLLFVCFLLQRCSADATLVTDTLENGDMTVTCSAQDVLDMTWTLFSFRGIGRHQEDFDAVLRSATEDVAVTQGITLSSEITGQSHGVYSTVRSTMNVSSSLRQWGEITFHCGGLLYGQTRYKSFFESAGIFSDFPYLSPFLPEPYPQSTTNPPALDTASTQDLKLIVASSTTTLSEAPMATTPPLDPAAPKEMNPTGPEESMMPTQQESSRPTQPEESSRPTQPEESSRPNPPRESDHTNENSEMTKTADSTSSVSPTGSSIDHEYTTVPISIWVAVATVSVLILVFVGVTILVCCIVWRRRKTAPAPEETHHYDYIDSNRIYTLTRGVATPTVPAASHPITGEYYEEVLEYIDMAPATDKDQPISGTLLQTLSPQSEPEYLSIRSQTLPPVVVATCDSDLTTNVAYNSSIEMVNNVAYPAIGEEYGSSGEYI